MRAMTISDLHLTEKSEDEYRWKVFDWVLDQARKNKCDRIWIMGDVLDKKDRHPSELVNRVVRCLTKLAKEFDLTILMGNHDYLKEEHPFLGFINNIANIRFITKPVFDEKDKIYWLPHTRTPLEDWKNIDFSKANLVCMHQSVIGCIVSNLHELNHGLDLDLFTPHRETLTLISGDIHVPQIVVSKQVELEYIGTPYPISFGDDYRPRGVVITEEGITDSVFTDFIKKLHLKIDSSSNLDEIKATTRLVENDQIIVTIELHPADFENWSKIRTSVISWARQNKIVLKDVRLKKIITDTNLEVKNTTDEIQGREISVYAVKSATELVTSFCEKNSISDEVKVIGLRYIGEISSVERKKF